MIIKRNNIWIIFFLCIFFLSCGYRFVGTGSFPAGIKSVFIPILKNHTSETGLENIITNDLIYEVTRRKISISSSSDKAGAVLSGAIRSMTIETISYKNPSTPLERRVTVAVDLKLTAHSGEVVWSTKGFSDYEEYYVTPDKMETERNRRDATIVLSKRLAEKLYNNITAGF